MPTMPFRFLALAAMLVCNLGGAAPLAAENWPQWRGPYQNGASREVELPVAWSEKSAVTWKCKLPEWGDSTPVIWENAIFLTSNTEEGALLLVKIDKRSGRIEWTRQVGTGKAERMPLGLKSGAMRRHMKFHATQNLATPSAATDGQVVVCHYGNGDLAAYDFEGKQLWKRNLQKDHGTYTIWWGHANSPVLYRNLVISACIQDSCRDLPGEPSPSYLVAHDSQTGVQKWFTPRPTEAPAECGDAYTTPLLNQAEDGMEMIVMGGLVLDSYDPATGKRRWYLDGLAGNRVITGPVVARGTLFATEGMRRDVLAVKLGGQGRLDRGAILWKHEQGTPDSPTPVVWDKLLFLVTDNGVAKCLDAETGRLYWKERLKGDYRASPLAADGRIYFLNMKGLTTVVGASTRFDRLTENQLDDETIATPVVSDGKLFIRSRKWLYCIGK
jgi:outer membrane protein assembly factor BamB